MDKIINKAVSKSNFTKYLYEEDIEVLCSIKSYVDDLYYNTGEETGLTDEQYDMLKETLYQRDPTLKIPVGAKLRKGENRAKLPVWMGSMDKYVNDKDIQTWISKQYEGDDNMYSIGCKLDGVSCLFVSENGEHKLYTRGDGVIGADISYLFPYIHGLTRLQIPVSLVKKDTKFIVRGELIMKRDIFESKYKVKFANPRNLVSGVVGAKTLREAISDIDFVAYEMVKPSQYIPSEQLERLSDYGFNVVDNMIVSRNRLVESSLVEILKDMKNNCDYHMDGIVIHRNYPYKRNISGNPKYAFAFKIRSEENITNVIVKQVEWNISKHGKYKPTIVFNEVRLFDTMVTHTSGFNAKFIVDNNIGPGSVLKITKGGEIIPDILEVLKPSPGGPQLPHNKVYVWNESQVDIMDPTGQNAEADIKRIAYFFSKLGVKHLAEKTVEKLYLSGFDSILNIINATQEDLEKVPGFGKRGAERIYTNIHSSLNREGGVPIHLLLGSCGIFGHGIGERKLKVLFESIPNLLFIYTTLSTREIKGKIMEVDGYSEKTTKQIMDNMNEAISFANAMKKYIRGVIDSTPQPQRPPTRKSGGEGRIMGKVVVFTGFRDKTLETLICEGGGSVTTSVSRNTDILIVPTEEDIKPTGKIKKAKDLGINIVSKEYFMSTYIK